MPASARLLAGATETFRLVVGGAARVVLAQANGAVSQLGAVADYLNVDRRDERAVEAILGDLLQHVVVPQDLKVKRFICLNQPINRGGHLPRILVQNQL